MRESRKNFIFKNAFRHGLWTFLTILGIAIAVNISHTFAFSDGLSAGEWEQLQNALGPKYLPKIIRAERLPLDFISIRIPDMLPTYNLDLFQS